MLNLDKTAWKRVTLRDVVRHVTDRVDAETSGLERFLAGEHIPSGSLSITDWGLIGRDPIGPMFYKRFKPSHVLYVSRRTYLRKVAVPEFEGITGEKTFVLETLDQNVLLQEFLPFILSAERFHAYAIAHSRGSVNPYLNWGELAAYEFALPPLDEQQRLADLFWSVERHRLSVSKSKVSAATAADVYFSEMLAKHAAELVPAPDLIDKMTVGVVVKPTQYYTDDREAGVPALRGLNVLPGGFDLTDLVYFRPESAADLQKSMLREGDIVVIRTGRPGDAAVVPTEVAGYNCIDLIIVRPGQHINSKFLELFLNSGYGRAQITRRSAGTAQQHFNVGALKKVQIPALPLDEQRVLVSATTEIQTVSDRFADELDGLQAMRGAMLNDVFGGAE